jgi:uncharacterized protein YceH (UPF0502 family)
MIDLSPLESRVLGVLIEKATTTPDQYPLSLNAITNGANQKNNRDPVTSITEDQAYDAVEGLRGKGLVVRIDIPGNRVPKFRHEASQVLHARGGEIAILAELLLRGPQTLGELRGRASRMHPMATLEDAKGMVRALMERDEPLVRELPPEPGSRAERYAQLLCPDLHPIEASAHASAAPSELRSPSDDRVARLEQRVERLEGQLRQLADALGHRLDPQP